MQALSNSLAAPPTGVYSDPTQETYYTDVAYTQGGQIPSTTTSAGPSRRDREREPERDGRHHRTGGRR